MHEVKRWKHPQCYMGVTWDNWFSSGFGQSRDSDHLEASNFATAYETLKRTAKDTPDGEETTVQIVRESHWAVGWVEWIAVHESDTETLEAAKQLCERCNDYPVLNEEDWSNRQYEAAASYWESESVAERVRIIQRYGKPYVSVFAARRSELPQNDNGSIFEHCAS